MPVAVTLECSGADVLSLCAAAVLAYPTRWRRRIAGAAGGVALILGLNTLRIGMLGRAAASPSFQFLHLYVWPGLLTLAAAAYAFTWMHFVDRQPASAAQALRRAGHGEIGTVEWRFAALALGLLVVFTAASPLYLNSPAVLAAATAVAAAAAWLLRAIGVDATASTNLLVTGRGAFLITQECISTPLLPVFVAAVFAFARTWTGRGLALAGAIPLFFALGVARLLVVALPATLVGTGAFAIHAFSQVLLAVVLVWLIARWRDGAAGFPLRRVFAALLAGGVAVYLLGFGYADALDAAVQTVASRPDPQGAVRLLPGFQVGFYIALVIAGLGAWQWRLWLTGLAILAASHVLLFALLDRLAELHGFVPHTRDVRAWTLAGPLLLLIAVVRYERAPP
ncbi:MAG: hypothetical protein ABIS06_08730 [Vicinamibacterales bacterium]